MNISTWCYFAFGPERKNTFSRLDFFPLLSYVLQVIECKLWKFPLLFALDTNKQKLLTKQKNMIYNSLPLHFFPAIFNHIASLMLQLRRDEKNNIHPFSGVYCRERAKFGGCLLISGLCKCRVFDLSSICSQAHTLTARYVLNSFSRIKIYYVKPPVLRSFRIVGFLETSVLMEKSFSSDYHSSGLSGSPEAPGAPLGASALNRHEKVLWLQLPKG